MWQVETNFGWQYYPDAEQIKIDQAVAAGEQECRFELRQWPYRLDLVAWLQINLETGKERAIRRAGGASGPPEACEQCGSSSEPGSLVRVCGRGPQYHGERVELLRWVCGACADQFFAGRCHACEKTEAWSGSFGPPLGAFGHRWFCSPCWSTRCGEPAGLEPQGGICCLCDRSVVKGRDVWFEASEGSCAHATCARAALEPSGGSCRVPHSEQASPCPDWVLALEGLRQCCHDLAAEGVLSIARGTRGEALTELPAAWLKTCGITQVSISCHNFKDLPDELGRMLDLHALTLSAVPLLRLPETIGNLQALRRLWIVGTAVSELPDGLATLPALTNVVLNANLLSKLPHFTSPRLVTLNVAGNRLVHASGSYRQATKLKALRLNGNQLDRIPDFEQSSFVEEVHVMDNKLVSLPSCVDLAFNLRWLLIANNRLAKLPEALLNLPLLESIVAYSNRLVELPLGLARKLGMQTLLLERNPLSVDTLCDLLPPPASLKTLGLDSRQLAAWSSSAGASRPEAAHGVASGSCEAEEELPFYLKLCRASRMGKGIKRPLDVDVSLAGQLSVPATVAAATPGELSRPRLLVIAFAASHASGPEWNGLLQEVPGKRHGDWAAWSYQRSEGPWQPGVDCSPVCGASGSEFNDASAFWDLWRHYWELERMPDDAFHGLDVPDFDVLSVVDARLRWYTGAFEQELRQCLEAVASRYQRCLLLGASMGGFGTLLHADLADCVLAFAPQVSLEDARLRPGATAEELRSLSNRVCEVVERAQRSSRRTRVHVHCPMDEYLHHALRLPLPPGGVVVHPLSDVGRPFTTLLRDVRLLWHIVASAVSDLSSDGASPWDCPDSPQQELSSGTCSSRRVCLARWTQSRLYSYTMPLGEVLRLARSTAPSPGDWFCARGHLNAAVDGRCRLCHLALGTLPCLATDRESVIVPGGEGVCRWVCTRCGHAEKNNGGTGDACGRCAAPRSLSVRNRLAAAPGS